MNSRSDSRLRYVAVSGLTPPGPSPRPAGRRAAPAPPRRSARPAARPSCHVQVRGARGPAGQDERAQLLQLVVEAVAVGLEVVHPDVARPAAAGTRRTRRAGCTGPRRRRTGRSARGSASRRRPRAAGRRRSPPRSRVGLVGVGVGGQAQVGLARAAEVAEAAWSRRRRCACRSASGSPWATSPCSHGRPASVAVVREVPGRRWRQPARRGAGRRRQEQRPEADGGGAARRRPHAADQRPDDRRRDDHGRAAAPARVHGRLATRTTASSRSTSRSGSATGPTTSWSGRCAPRSASSARSSPASARPTSRCPAATPSARAGSTCTPRVWRRSAPRSTSTHGYLIAAAPQGLHGADVRLEFPSVGATENVLMASVLATGAPGIDNAAREPEIVDIAELLDRDGRGIDRAPAPRRSTSTASTRSSPSSTPSSPTASPPAPGRSPPRPPAATSRSSGAVADHLEISLDPLAARGRRGGDDARRASGWSAWTARPRVVRRRHAALPRVPHRPAAVRADLQRGRRRQRHDHREPLRGPLPDGAGAGPPRRRRPDRRPPRHGPRRRRCSRVRRSRPATSAPAPRSSSPVSSPTG